VRCTEDLADRPWTLHAYGATPDEVELVGFDGTVARVRLATDPRVVRHDG
jgi:hypothetical protein